MYVYVCMYVYLYTHMASYVILCKVACVAIASKAINAQNTQY